MRTSKSTGFQSRVVAVVAPTPTERLTGLPHDGLTGDLQPPAWLILLGRLDVAADLQAVVHDDAGL